MLTRQPMPPTYAAPSGVQIFAANERINQLLIEHLDPAVWTAKPPGNVRTIAAIFTHMHNVRTKWIRLTATHLRVPAQLNRAHCTPQQARKALAESAARCEEILAGVDDGRIHKGERVQKGRGVQKEKRVQKGKSIQQFVRDGWAKPWPAGPDLLTKMLSYMLAHEAHHRGQVAMLSHQLGSHYRKRSHRTCGMGKILEVARRIQCLVIGNEPTLTQFRSMENAAASRGSSGLQADE